jgi:hypothetical protein
MDFVVVAKVAMVAVFPKVASVGIEERVVTRAIGKLDTGEATIRHGSLWLKDRSQQDQRKKYSDDCEDRLRINVNAHVSASYFLSQISGRQNLGILGASNITLGLNTFRLFWPYGA